MNITASFSSAASVCLCAGLLAAAGCSKPVAAPEPQPSKPASVAGEFNADGAMALDAKPAVDPSKALVTVDGAVLSYGEADAMVKRMLVSQGAPEAQLDAILQQMGDSMRGRIVDQFVVSTLLKNEALARKIEITDAEIEVTLSNLTARLPPGTDLKTALANMGVTLEQVRKDVSDNERIRKLYESETGKIPAATDAEVAAYYDENAEQFTKGEEVTARHILVGSREEDAAKKAEAKAKAEGLRKQLVEGADFATLAAANSDCPSKSEGGSLGSFGRGRMVPAFDEAAFALATNVISEVVETPFGFHIIQVTDRKAGGKTSLEEVREKVAEQLTAKKRNEVFEKVIEGLRAKATIVQDTPPAAPMVEEDAVEVIESAPGAVIESAPATAPEAPAPEAPAPAAK
jgi:peptidyl-prolyl cis-trans isomerase C